MAERTKDKPQAQEPTIQELLDVARQGLTYAPVFQAIGRLPEVVQSITAAYNRLPELEHQLTRLQGELDLVTQKHREARATADAAHTELEERNRKATAAAEAAEDRAMVAEADAERRIADSRERADKAIHDDEARVVERERALADEIKRLETEHEGRKQLLRQREHEAREAAELAEERLRDLAASIPVPR